MPELCVIESDNCTSQYKSAHHFHDIQAISDQIQIPIIKLYSVAGHGKGEVDHVGGLAKIAIRRYIGTGGIILDAADCINFLENKFQDKTNPKFHFREICTTSLLSTRADAHTKTYRTIEGSTLFQVMVFKPNCKHFRAAPHLCVCSDCMRDYGSCSLFDSYELLTGELKKINLRSHVEPVVSEVEVDFQVKPSEFVLQGTYCALAADKSSTETIWFVKIKDAFEAKEITDDYFNTIVSGQQYIEGRFLGKTESAIKGNYYKLQKQKTFFFHELVVYPYVQFQEGKKGLLLSVEEYVEILNYVEHIGISHL